MVMSNRDLPPPLSEAEFASAFAKGLGRAKIQVNNYGLDNVVDIVLDACVHDRANAPQCESSRAAWLFEMFDHSPYDEKFRTAILFALENETEVWDVLQLCELAKEMAAHGDDNARLSLKRRVFELAGKASDHESFGANEWIKLEGLDGFLELAVVYGNRLLKSPNEWVPDDLYIFYDNADFDWRDALVHHAKDDPSIEAYLRFLEKRGMFNRPPASSRREMGRKRYTERIRNKYPIERIVANARNHVYDYPGHYTSFGHVATKEELQDIYTLLMNEVDEAALVRFLWIFRRASLPRINATVLNWARGMNGQLRSAAIDALARIKDPQVHELAREKVQALAIIGDDCSSLDLFTHNYQSEDAQTIMQALSSIEPQTWEIHTLGRSIMQLSEQHRDPALADALKWGYENTPCSDCRERLIKELDKIGKLDESLLKECLFDAVEDTRVFAKERYDGLVSTGHDAT